MHVPADRSSSSQSTATHPVLAALDRALQLVNQIIAVAAAIAMILACGILSYSVISRSLFQNPTYWQDEAAIFLLVGATFMTAAYVQSHRGHIGIEAFASLISPRANRIRGLIVDIACFVFCTFFAWKSWTLTHEAYVDGQISNSIWGPPLAIPYSMMSIGMTLLCLQILLQVLKSLFDRKFLA